MNSSISSRIRDLLAFRATVTHGAWLLDSKGEPLALCQVSFQSSETPGIACEIGTLTVTKTTNIAPFTPFNDTTEVPEDETTEPAFTALYLNDLCHLGKTLRMAGDQFPIEGLTLGPRTSEVAFHLTKPVKTTKSKAKTSTTKRTAAANNHQERQLQAA